MEDNPRDHGLGEVQKVVGIPRVARIFEVGEVPGCPYCGCERLALINVDVEDKRLRHGRGLGTYHSCLACPWASQMMVVTQPPEKEGN
jgi:hypothetical protein